VLYLRHFYILLVNYTVFFVFIKILGLLYNPCEFHTLNIWRECPTNACVSRTLLFSAHTQKERNFHEKITFIDLLTVFFNMRVAK
jgi:hypothetical protein